MEAGERRPGDVTFYVVRHGQTLFNVMGKVQGWCDTPLTDEGVRAAEALGLRGGIDHNGGSPGAELIQNARGVFGRAREHRSGRNLIIVDHDLSLRPEVLEPAQGLHLFKGDEQIGTAQFDDRREHLFAEADLR